MAVLEVIEEFGVERARHAAMKYRVIMDMHAARNANAHRRFNLSFDMIDDLMQKIAATRRRVAADSHVLAVGWCRGHDLRLRRSARNMRQPPVWVQDHVTVHREETMLVDAVGAVSNEARSEITTHRYAANKLFARNGITRPREELDVLEMYAPSAWWGLSWIRDFLLLEGDEHLQMVERGDIQIEGSFPINPSGCHRDEPNRRHCPAPPARSVLQVRGDAGTHQVPREVRKALASGFGGTLWTVLMLLSKDLPD